MEPVTLTGVVLQQGDGGAAAAGAFFLVTMLFSLAVALLTVAGMWKAFQKAGQPGWAAIIPIYNVWIMLKVAGDPGWWLILLLIPVVNFVIIIVVSIHVAEAFGRGALFGLGLAFISFVFWPLLGFGDDSYQGTAA